MPQTDILQSVADLEVGGREIVYEGADLYPKQRAAIFAPERISVIEASPQPLDTKVYTPEGPRLLGDLEIGDEVCTPDGVSSVVNVHDFGSRPVYKLTISDGTSTRATWDHKWRIILDTRDKSRVISTGKLAGWSQHTRNVWRLPRIQSVQYRERDVPLDPWLVGFLIGDGCIASPSVVAFSTADPEIVDRVRGIIAPQYEVREDAACSYRYIIRAAVHGAARVRLNKNIRYKLGGYEVNLAGKYLGRFKTREEAEHCKASAVQEKYGDLAIEVSLHEKLREIDLLGKRAWEKCIPEIYRYNSEEVRLEVLRGILDSDGHVSQKGGIVLDQTSEQLAVDVQELVEGLGGIARWGKPRVVPSNCRQNYRLNIRHPDNALLVWLPRKRALAMKRADRGWSVRRISNIEPCGEAPVRCIEIDSQDRLYLTDHCIPTHNSKAGKTSGSLAWLLEQSLQHGKPGRSFWWVAPVYSQAEIAYRRMKHKVPRNLYKSNEQKLRLTLINGAMLEFRSSERPDGLYGDDVYAAVLDEASRMREAAWYAVRSTLTFTKGPVRIIGNVRGRKNWFYQLARQAEAGTEGMSYHRITAYEAAEAGVLDKEEVERARVDFERLGRSDVFRELYLAEAGSGANNPFGTEAIKACTVDNLSTNKPVVAGVDLAGRGASNVQERDERADRDYTAIVMLDKDGTVCHLDRFQMPHGETEARILSTVGRTRALMDSTGTGDAIVEWCQRSGKMNATGFTFTSRTKQDLMERLAIAIQNEEVHFPEGILVDELEAFQFEHTRSGVRYAASPGAHDDAVMALALAVWHRPLRLAGSAPLGMPSTSRWRDDSDGEAGRRYLDSQKPTLVGGAEGPRPLNVPQVIRGPGAGKWG